MTAQSQSDRAAVEAHPKLRPYASLGMKFNVTGLNAYSTCPFCTREGKFSVKVEDGRWRCVVCNEGKEGGEASKTFKGGNVFTFIRLLWEKSPSQDKHLEQLAVHRSLLLPQTLVHWGVRKSLINGDWILPGWGPDGKLMTLYRYVRLKTGWKVLATAELGHHLFGVPLWGEKNHTVYVCEGPWDAMCLWEVLRQAKRDDSGGLKLTGNVGKSLLGEANVLAVPSCSVWNDKWKALLKGHHVVLCFDNDLPRSHPETKDEIPPAAREGVKRAALSLMTGDDKASAVSTLLWGEEGYDPGLPSGTDVRDILSQASTPQGRIRVWEGLSQMVKPIPASWGVGDQVGPNGQSQGGLPTSECKSWRQLLPFWRKAMKWTKGLNRALACMLATSASTMTQGDQLWIKVISSPSGGKSTLCEAISVAKKFVTAKSTLRGFHSGYRSDNDGKEDNSLIPQIMGKTLVTKDGDTLLTSPNLDQILSEGRDLYDTTARTHYRNKVNRDYEGVRFTWILCGTSALRQIDRSELGQRFLDVVIMERIDDDLEDEILERKAHQVERAARVQSNGKAETHNDPDMVEAMAHTGGYVEYLRMNVGELLSKVQVMDEHREAIKGYAKFIAHMRARPSTKQTEGSGREMAGRLLSQLMRLAMHLCVVFNKERTDDEVMEIVRQVALDTGRGVTLEMCKILHKKGPKGAEHQILSDATNEQRDKGHGLIKLLVAIEAVEVFEYRPVPTLPGQRKYRLTPKMSRLYALVHKAWGGDEAEEGAGQDGPTDADVAYDEEVTIEDIEQ